MRQNIMWSYSISSFWAQQFLQFVGIALKVSQLVQNAPLQTKFERKHESFLNNDFQVSYPMYWGHEDDIYKLAFGFSMT